MVPARDHLLSRLREQLAPARLEVQRVVVLAEDGQHRAVGQRARSVASTVRYRGSAWWASAKYWCQARRALRSMPARQIARSFRLQCRPTPIDVAVIRGNQWVAVSLTRTGPLPMN